MENTQLANKNTGESNITVVVSQLKKPDEPPQLQDQVITIDVPTIQQQTTLVTTFPQQPFQPLTIQITKYLTQTSYLLLQTQVYSLKIATPTLTIQTTRTNHDLSWLSDTIRSKYPGIGLPVHQINVVYDAAEERTLTVELFLRFLVNHEILKHSPEAKYFFLDSIGYLQWRKLMELEGKDGRAKGVGGIGRIQGLVKAMFMEKKAGKELSEKLALGEVMEQEQEIKEARDTLKQILLFRSKSCDLKAEVYKNESTILSIQNDCQELKGQLDQLRKTMLDGHDKFKKQIVNQYLSSGIFMQLVSLNLDQYLQLFDIIRSLQQSILTLKNGRQFGQMYQEQRYLQLLKNNMKRDIKGWLNMNNRILNQALK